MDTVGKVPSLVMVNQNVALLRQNTLYQNSQGPHPFLGKWNKQGLVRQAAICSRLCAACLSMHAAGRTHCVLFLLCQYVMFFEA
jgi:hypothetical protein